MARLPTPFSHLTSLRERYYEALPGKEELVRVVTEAEIPEHVYDSNAIENSTLSLEETEKVLLQIDLDRYVSEREIFEVKNLARVVAYMENRAKEQEVSLELMCLLHKMLISNIRDDIAGRFRQDNEWVRVGGHVGSDPKNVERLLTDMLMSYHASADTHIITRIARFHLTFEHIHPFVDGNGRIGRALNNYLLIREGYVPINITFADRARYFEAFDEFRRRDTSVIMEELIGRALTASYHKRLAYLEGQTIVTLASYAKDTRLSHSNLINKAVRQTIPAWQEKGVWKIAATPAPPR